MYICVSDWGRVPNYEHAVQQIDGDAVGREHVSPSDGTHTSVGREYHDGRERRLQGAVQKGEALNIQHVHLTIVNESEMVVGGIANAIYNRYWNR